MPAEPMAEQVAGLIQMGVGQKRYETELAFKQQDQQMQERESALRNQATALQIQSAQGSMNDATSARALDAGNSILDTDLVTWGLRPSPLGPRRMVVCAVMRGRTPMRAPGK